MRLYRGIYPESVMTDSIRPDFYTSGWEPGERIKLRGTKTEGASRETDLFLEIDEEDVIALFYALLEHYRKSVVGETELGVCAETSSRLALCLKSAIRPLVSDLGDLSRPIEELGLSGRTHEFFQLANIRTVGDIAQMTQEEVLRAFGRRMLDELKSVLASLH
jgi:hypothetical protein